MFDTALRKVSEVGSYTCALESVEDVRKFMQIRFLGEFVRHELLSQSEADYFPGEGRECDYVGDAVGVNEPEDEDELRDAQVTRSEVPGEMLRCAYDKGGVDGGRDKLRAEVLGANRQGGRSPGEWTG